jgi:hypothetical protein
LCAKIGCMQENLFDHWRHIKTFPFLHQTHLVWQNYYQTREYLRVLIIIDLDFLVHKPFHQLIGHTITLIGFVAAVSVNAIRSTVKT